MDNQSLLIINGSFKKKGTSGSFADQLKIISESKGKTATVLHLSDIHGTDTGKKKLKNELAQCTAIGLVAPLYADTLPYGVILLLETMLSEFSEEMKGKSFFSVIQCGFPDNSCCIPAIKSTKFFTADAQMKWLGGVGYGLGSMIGGKPLTELGAKGAKLISALDLMIEDVLHDRNISLKVQQLLDNRIPAFAYSILCTFLNRQFDKIGKQNGVNDLALQPYLKV